MFKNHREVKIELVCDLCKSEFYVGLDDRGRENYIATCSVNFYPALDFQPVGIGQSLGMTDTKLVSLNHVCRPCREAISTAVETKIQELRKA